jgi:hypothetical protein
VPDLAGFPQGYQKVVHGHILSGPKKRPADITKWLLNASTPFGNKSPNSHKKDEKKPAASRLDRM